MRRRDDLSFAQTAKHDHDDGIQNWLVSVIPCSRVPCRLQTAERSDRYGWMMAETASTAEAGAIVRILMKKDDDRPTAAISGTVQQIPLQRLVGQALNKRC